MHFCHLNSILNIPESHCLNSILGKVKKSPNNESRFFSSTSRFLYIIFLKTRQAYIVIGYSYVCASTFQTVCLLKSAPGPRPGTSNLTVQDEVILSGI